MAHKFDPKHLNKLDNEWRRENMPPVETLKALGLMKDDILADIGSGIGYFTIPAVHEIGVKKGYALDTSNEMLEELKRREQSVYDLTSEIEIVLTDEYDLKLADDTVTFVLMVNVLHEIDDKLRFIAKINEITKAGGKLAIIEWMKVPTESGPPLEHRIGQEEAVKMIQNAGYKIKSMYEFAENFYGLVAEKQ